MATGEIIIRHPSTGAALSVTAAKISPLPTGPVCILLQHKIDERSKLAAKRTIAAEA
jgi:hypothetical protein